MSHVTMTSQSGELRIYIQSNRKRAKWAIDVRGTRMATGRGAEALKTEMQSIADKLDKLGLTVASSEIRSILHNPTS
jgi:hypothetical protein